MDVLPPVGSNNQFTPVRQTRAKSTETVPTQAAETEAQPVATEPPPDTFDRHAFFSLNNTLHRSELQFGVLPINNDTDRLLFSGQIIDQREPAADNFYHSQHQHVDYVLEPQYQRHLGDGWELYARLPLTVHSPYDEVPSSLDLLTDVTVGHNWDETVFRLEYGANNLGNDGEPSQYVTFTPYYRFNLYEDYLTFRLGAKYACYFGNDYDNHLLTLEAKIGGMIRAEPWSGWGIQAFVPVALDPELDEGQRRIELGGIYAWLGSVLPRDWFGPGFFIEGGVWIGGRIGESPTPGQDIAAGINIKLKYGTEGRWWQ